MTNGDIVDIANAYILTNPPNGQLAEKHLREAYRLSPLDPEIVSPSTRLPSRIPFVCTVNEMQSHQADHAT